MSGGIDVQGLSIELEKKYYIFRHQTSVEEQKQGGYLEGVIHLPKHLKDCTLQLSLRHSSSDEAHQQISFHCNLLHPANPARSQKTSVCKCMWRTILHIRAGKVYLVRNPCTGEEEPFDCLEGNRLVLGKNSNAKNKLLLTIVTPLQSTGDSSKASIDNVIKDILKKEETEEHFTTVKKLFTGKNGINRNVVQLQVLLIPPEKASWQKISAMSDKIKNQKHKSTAPIKVLNKVKFNQTVIGFPSSRRCCMLERSNHTLLFNNDIDLANTRAKLVESDGTVHKLEDVCFHKDSAAIVSVPPLAGLRENDLANRVIPVKASLVIYRIDDDSDQSNPVELEFVPHSQGGCFCGRQDGKMETKSSEEPDNSSPSNQDERSRMELDSSVPSGQLGLIVDQVAETVGTNRPVDNAGEGMQPPEKMRRVEGGMTVEEEGGGEVMWSAFGSSLTNERNYGQSPNFGPVESHEHTSGIYPGLATGQILSNDYQATGAAVAPAIQSKEHLDKENRSRDYWTQSNVAQDNRHDNVAKSALLPVGSNPSFQSNLLDMGYKPETDPDIRELFDGALTSLADDDRSDGPSPRWMSANLLKNQRPIHEAGWFPQAQAKGQMIGTSKENQRVVCAATYERPRMGVNWHRNEFVSRSNSWSNWWNYIWHEHGVWIRIGATFLVPIIVACILYAWLW